MSASNLPAEGIATIRAEDARPIRQLVLRPGQPADRLIYPNDDAPGTLHLGVRISEGAVTRLVSVASFYREPVSDLVREDLAGCPPLAPGVRIRGMATLEPHRNRGFGRALVEHALHLLTERGDQFDALWCNARTTAAGYYTKLGFAIGSDGFDLPDIGPHLVMVRRVPREHATA